MPSKSKNQRKNSDKINSPQKDDDCAFKKGVWYYFSEPLSDHNDLAGVDTLSRTLALNLGLDYRSQYYINTFNRIRLLKFQELDDFIIEKKVK